MLDAVASRHLCGLGGLGVDSSGLVVNHRIRDTTAARVSAASAVVSHEIDVTVAMVE